MEEKNTLCPPSYLIGSQKQSFHFTKSSEHAPPGSYYAFMAFMSTILCQTLDQFSWNYAAESIQSFCTFLRRIQLYTVRSETVPTHNTNSLSLSLSHARTYTSTHSRINTIRLKQVLVEQVWLLCCMISLVPICDRNRVKRKLKRDCIPKKSKVLYEIVSVKDTHIHGTWNWPSLFPLQKPCRLN